MKPMLAGKLDSIDDVRYPVLCTPKLDGIRCLIVDGEAVSRKLKPIPNAFVRTRLRGLPNWLDGELMVPGAENFGETSSAIMSRDGTPEFEYHVFDIIDPNEGYDARVRALQMLDIEGLPPFVRLLLPAVIQSREALVDYEERCLFEGHEGVMLRSADGPYKHGRSTVREGYLLKLKRFEDDEAVVIGFEELLRNENELGQDALGHAKRSKAKAGMVPGGTLGKLLVRRADGVEFAIGSGFTASQRDAIWADQAGHLGLLVKFKHQPHGAQEKPRWPAWDRRERRGEVHRRDGARRARRDRQRDPPLQAGHDHLRSVPDGRRRHLGGRGRRALEDQDDDLPAGHQPLGRPRRFQVAGHEDRRNF
jgi:DNA ligase-1